MGVLTFSFPLPDNLLNMNDRGHWAPRAESVRVWRTASFVAARNALGLNLRLGMSVVSFILPVKSLKVRHDPSNLYPTVKAILDGMVDAKVWDDDDRHHVATTEPDLARGGLVHVSITPWVAV